jgi:hypothetical protein
LEASFDRRGRIIISLGPPANCTLVYEGVTRDVVRPHQAQFERLLAQLDDPKWSAREGATAELRRRVDEFLPLLPAALAQDRLSSEAQARIKAILDDRKSATVPRQVLFERMHPPLLTPGNR